jgi:hypothetical protein
MSCRKMAETVCEVCKKKTLYSRHLSTPPKTCGRLSCMIAKGETTWASAERKI